MSQSRTPASFALLQRSAAQLALSWRSVAQHCSLMERLELISFHRSLIFMEMCKRILGSVMVRIVISVNGLSFQPGNGIKLLDGGRAQTRKCSEHCPLDF